jgi:hypothetical protein
MLKFSFHDRASTSVLRYCIVGDIILSMQHVCCAVPYRPKGPFSAGLSVEVQPTNA